MSLKVLVLRQKDGDLAHETSTLESLYGGQVELSTWLIKPNIDENTKEPPLRLVCRFSFGVQTYARNMVDIR